MEYVLAGILVLLLIAGWGTFHVVLARRKSGPETGRDASAGERDDTGLPSVGTDRETPLGDTSEHAGIQTPEGRTIGEQDAVRSGGSGHAVGKGYAATGAIGESEEERLDRFGRERRQEQADRQRRERSRSERRTDRST